MDVACSTFCFPSESLEQALRHIVELEFTKVDLGVGSDGPHLKPDELIEDLNAVLGRIRQGPTVGISGVTARLTSTGEAEVREIEAIAHLAKQLATAVVTIEAFPNGTPMETEIARLQALYRAADRHGVGLCVLTKVGTLADNPDDAKALCDAIPGLALTLDPSCYTSGTHTGPKSDDLYPLAKHVVLRDSGAGMDRFQVAVGRGEIDYSKVVASLEQCRFRGTMVVDFEPQWGGDLDVEAEARKLGRVLESLL